MQNMNNLPRILRNNERCNDCSGLRKVMKTSTKLLVLTMLWYDRTCCCEALARQRYKRFWELTTEPNVIHTATVKDLSLFITHTGLSKLC
jgi:hypothetical protein